MNEHTGFTATLARFASEGATAPANRDIVVQTLVDTVGVSLAAAGMPGERLVRSWSAQERPSGGAATIWSTGHKTTAAWAALLNGNAAHVLDYDDYSPSMPMHPSAVLWPALLAVGQTRDVATARLGEAYEVGAAVFRTVADALPDRVHYERGWHTTGTVGRLAAVAALVRLVGADPLTARHALAIASSLSSGSRANFGSMTKPLHAGLAARDAVTALELAETGLTGNPAELEAEGGFLQRLGDPRAGDRDCGQRLSHWSEHWPRDWGLKRYPACYGAHRAIDATLAVRAGVDIDVLSSIDVVVHSSGLTPLLAHPPSTPMEAKFSLEYCVALALLTGRVGLGDFTDAGFGRTRIRDLAAKVSIAEASAPPIGTPEFKGGFAVVTITGRDGVCVRERVDITRGDGRDPLSTGDLEDKFADCCRTGGYAEDRIGPLFTALLTLPSAASYSDLADLLGSRTATGALA